MTRQQKQSIWFEHIRAWRGSGLSQSAYCARHGLGLAAFGYWLRREREAGSAGYASPVAPLPALVPLRLQPSSALSTGMILRGPGAWQVELPPGTPAAWVVDVLRGLT